ncbi:MAG: hypothetical protein KA064_02590 [Firmicutes bacterium]|nr:hypothetical protein [Bacillota bacterium]
MIDLAACALVPNFIEQHAGVTAMALSADGRRLVVAGGDRVIRIWDLLGRRQVGSEVRMNVPVESVDVSADGKRIAVGMRFGDSAGQLQMLSGEGLALWEKPRSFMSGVQKVRFAQDGNSIATAFCDNSVAVFDSATGKPRTDEMEQALAIAELRFLDSELSGSIIGVGCGGPNAQGGTATAWVLLDKGTGRKLSDPVTHSGNVRGLAVLPGGRFASWSTSGCIVAAVPRALGQQGWKPGLFSAITTALGGWRINEWRAPEAVVGDPAQALALAHGVPDWEALLAWWAAPTAQRTVEPGSTVKLATRLEELVTKGYLAEYRQVLDLQPDHPTAMAEYWFTAAREATTDALLKGDTVEDRKQRQMEWAQLSNEAKRDRIFANPKAKRLADFWTAELCAKHPDWARSWQERATFLRLVGREAEASDALAKALSLGGGDFASREQLALLKAQQGDFAGAAEQFDTLCDWLEKNPPTGDDALRTIAKAGQNRLHFGTVGRGMDNVGRDVRWLVDNLAKALAPIPRLTREQGNQLIDASEKLTDFLARFDAGPAWSAEAHGRLLEALTGRTGTNFETVQAMLLGHRAFAEILCGDTASAQRDLAEAKRICPDLEVGLEVWRAHALAIEGRADEAQAIYETMLELDAEMAGALSKELALDFQRLQRRGIVLRGLEALQRQVFARVASQPNGRLVVSALRPGDQAEKAGIKVGDRLVSYAGEPVLDWEWFAWERQIESRQGLREPRTVVVERDGKPLSFQVQSGRLGLGAK